MYITSKEFIRDFSVILWNRFSASNPCSRVVSGLFWRYWDILGLFSKKRGDCSGGVVIREMKKSYIDDCMLVTCHTRPSVRFLKFQRVPPRSFQTCTSFIQQNTAMCSLIRYIMIFMAFVCLICDIIDIMILIIIRSLSPSLGMASAFPNTDEY